MAIINYRKEKKTEINKVNFHVKIPFVIFFDAIN